MDTIDKLLVGVLILAIVAVVIASDKSTGAINAIGGLVAALAGNVVGTATVAG